jgi:uncharacterized protein YndB with AHSA1/START domain
MTTATGIDREFTLTRILDATPDVVFRAWTDPDHLAWFFSDRTDVAEPIFVDLHVGGEWRQKMIVDENTTYFTGGRYREIVPGRKLVFTWGALGGWPELDGDQGDEAPVVTVLLNDRGGKTEMVFTVAIPAHLTDDRVQEWFSYGIRDGWSQTIDRLVGRLANPV